MFVVLVVLAVFAESLGRKEEEDKQEGVIDSLTSWREAWSGAAQTQAGHL